MAIKNLGASGVLFTDRRDFYIDPNVTKELWTDVTPFTTVVSTKETRQTNDPVFKMFEHRNPWVNQKIQLSSTGAGTVPDSDVGMDMPTPSYTIGLEGGDGVNSTEYSSWAGLICEVWASGAVEDGAGAGVITGTASKGTVLIREKTGSDFELVSLSGATIVVAEHDWLVVVGNAHGEGTYSPEPWADELKVVYNSTQIFKTPLEITGTLLQASLRGESSELARLRVLKGQEHKIQKERAFLFGQSADGTALDGTGTMADTHRTDGGGKKARTTYGIISAINKYGNSSGDSQNKFTVSEASYSYSSFVDDMEKVFQYVPEAGVKQAFCGAGALGYWSKMAGNTGMAGNSGWTVNVSDMKRDALGFNYKTLETPHGILQLIPTPVLRGPYNKTMLVIDDSNMFHAQYRNQMYQTNIKTDNAYDGVKDQYMSDEGIGVSLIESHNLFTITA